MGLPTVDAAKVRIGRSYIYEADVPADGTALDALVPADDEDFGLTAGWTHVGYLLEGVTVNEASESYEVKADNIRGPITSIPMEESAEVTGELIYYEQDIVALLEGTERPTVVVVPGVGQPGTTTRAIGGGEAYVDKAIGIDAYDQQGYWTRHLLYDCQLSRTGGTVFRRGQESRVPFRALAMAREDLKDDTKAFGTFGFSRRMTAAATG